MPKLTAPPLPPGPRQTLSLELHTLHRRAGWPSVRDLSRALGDGVASPSRIHDAFTKPRLPAWGLLDVLVTELARRVPRADPTAVFERFHDLWETAAEAEGALGEETAEDQLIEERFHEALDRAVTNYYGPNLAPPADVQEAMWAAGRESQRQQHMPEPVIRRPYEPAWVTDDRVHALLRLNAQDRATQIPHMRQTLRELRAHAEAFQDQEYADLTARLIHGDIRALEYLLDEAERGPDRFIDLTAEDPGRQVDLTVGERPSPWGV
ncbi:hypothetical protein ACFTUC_41335 [Streptomyces sp. NPDC056944]|uniref:hypothetical protein n=1 Tax=Streptomyces sp. NPDC056944 TaxID=3345972 RepID=UPI00362755FC